ncbi:hypothetical protein GCK32_014797 [Trichostrongylus colubriformis]|uniref:Protein kinase domain-containing protein n=1 Tax=Trichostrongylus colubriformis TaxID=6319 RepID=A0AAN8F2H0_TRICO
MTRAQSNGKRQNIFRSPKRLSNSDQLSEWGPSAEKTFYTGTSDPRVSLRFPTAARLSIQALDAVSMLHSIKMLHTRIEPTHFCIGTDHRKNVLHLVGLGHITTFSKRPTWNRKAQYAPRPFASNNLANMELECWFLTMMDLFDRASLPWNKYKNMTRETIEERKLLLFAAPLGGSST